MTASSSQYTLLMGEKEYRAAIDTVLDNAHSAIEIFDHDLAALRLEEPQRLTKLANFLHAQHTCKLRIVIHQTQLLDSYMPRLMNLFAHYTHAVEVRQSPANLRSLVDTHLLADARHGVRRFHIDHARCALIREDPVAIQPWQQRFEALWQLSLPCPRIKTTGL